MIRAFWPDSTDLACQSRAPGPGVVSFDPLHDSDRLAAAMRGRRAVVCLSGVTPAHAAATGDPFSLNTDLALAALNAAAGAGVPRLMLASSAAVYGAAGGPLAEDMLCAPVSDYGRAKLQMEQAAAALAKDREQPVTMLRIGNVAGADAILGGWRADMRLDTLPDGSTPERSYIGPKTLAAVVHRLCLLDDLPEILNVAAPGTVAMGDLLDAAGLRWSSRAAGPATIGKVQLQTRRLENLVEFAPNAGTAESLVAEWRAYRARTDGPQ